MNEFKSYHPIVNFIYFFAVIGFSMVFMHPLCLAASLAAALAYSLLLGGKRVLRFELSCLLPLMLLSVVISPVFNHEGATILAYLPDGNPLTLESIAYSAAAACMIASVICWFSCLNKIMTSDKLIYLFGKIIPSLSLILSMTLRLVPRFAAQLGEVRAARRCIGRDITDGGLVCRMKNGIRILSVMITWSLENAIDTADSMKSRGYGLPGRTAFSVFRFDGRDAAALACIGALVLYILAAAAFGGFYFRYFPYITRPEITPLSISAMSAYLLLCGCPLIIEALEERRWKKSESKI